ncbi:hypothetical protein MC885_021115 [Smutsia gigantea]|nr:hypothetical protein MC885_021115 [Smutsia gigantea]
MRAMADLSNEASKSLTDEVQSSGSFSSSGGPQPPPHASGSKPESGRPTTCLEYQDKRSELSDFKNNETELSRRWINYLKGKETNSGQHRLDTAVHTESTRVSEEELNALRSFCSTKIKLLRHRANSKEKKSNRHQMLQPRWDAEASKADALNYSVPDELFNRIYFKNMRTTKLAATVKQHISSRCPSCNRKRAELAQSAFLTQKKTLLETFLLQKKIDEHLHTKDFLTFIGEAYQGLPRLSDDPRIIWERMKEKSQIRYSGFEKSDTKQKM